MNSVIHSNYHISHVLPYILKNIYTLRICYPINYTYLKATPPPHERLRTDEHDQEDADEGYPCGIGDAVHQSKQTWSHSEQPLCQCVVPGVDDRVVDNI